MIIQPVGKLTSRPEVRRCPSNPILSHKDVPYESALVYNPGVIKFRGRYVMVFRNDYGSFEEQRRDGTGCFGLAFSDDGVHWKVEPEPCFEYRGDGVAYDPRLTVIDGRCYASFALSTPHGQRAGVAALSDDFKTFDILSLSVPDNRNGVLFPEKINHRFVRLERPFWNMGVLVNDCVSHFDIWLSESPDLRFWGNSDHLLCVSDVPFANAKIGPGAPPVKTPDGWLVLFHAVDTDPARGKNGWDAVWRERYSAGVMLLDLADPRKLKGLCREPLLAPEADYEISGGIRNNVIFPTSMILEDSGEVKIYYGATDTIVCMATADVGDLLALCRQP